MASSDPEDRTEATYQRDAYVRELATEVVKTGREGGRPFAVTADTVFYPEGGGQPADRGTVAGVEVVDVRRSAGAIRHYLSEPVSKGPARLVLDWQRRYDHMQQHTGQHLLTATALRHFGWRTTAFHMGEHVSDIELDVPKLSADELRRIEDAVADGIRAGRPVTLRWAPPERMEELGVRSRLLPEDHSGELRLVEIEGLDLNTCGGTHLRSTAEIGVLALIGTEPMRGGTRVFFVAGDRVRRRLVEHEARNRQLRSLLDTGDEELPEVIALRMEREKEFGRDRRRLADELATMAAEVLAARPEAVLSGHWEERDMDYLQRLGRRLAERAPAKTAILTAGAGPDGFFVLAAGEEAGVDLEEIGPEVAAVLDGRGGGRPPLYQGRAGDIGRREQALELLREALDR